MRIMKLTGMFLVFALALMFAVIPLANAGEGGPPGDSKYAPPPYMGVLTLTYADPYVLLSGQLEQMHSGQIINFDNTSIAYNEFFPSEESIPFGDLTSKDLQGIWFTLDTPEQDYNLQVLGVGKLEWNMGRDGFSADFVMMEYK